MVCRLLCAVVLCSVLLVSSTAAPVKVIAADYVDMAKRLSNASVTWLEQGTILLTDANGEIMFDAPVGSNVTLELAETEEFVSLQTPTATVPAEGFVGSLGEIVLQAPSKLMFDLFWIVTPGKKDPTKCQVVVTVCNVNKTSFSPAQGLPGTVAHLAPPLQAETFYFGTWGNWSNATNPLPNHLNSTSYDGGVMFTNLPVDPATWYVVTATHPGFEFSRTVFRCTKAGFINGAPNQGPRIISRKSFE
jgi:hypothetical protein